MATRLLTHQVVGTTFAFYEDDEIRRLSVKKITNPQTFDTFNHPTARYVPYATAGYAYR